MKKLLMIILLAATMILCACQVNNQSTNVSDYLGELSKSQEISVIPANTSNATEILTDSEIIGDFITELDIDKWELKTLPQDAEILGTFCFSQETTIKFGQSKEDTEMRNICELKCYDKIPFIMLKFDHFDITFEISDKSAEYLKEYFIY